MKILVEYPKYLFLLAYTVTAFPTAAVLSITTYLLCVSVGIATTFLSALFPPLWPVQQYLMKRRAGGSLTGSTGCSPTDPGSVPVLRALTTDEIV